MAQDVRRVYSALAKYFGLRARDIFLNSLVDNTNSNQNDQADDPPPTLTNKDLFLEEIFGQSQIYADREALARLSEGLKPTDFCVTSMNASDAGNFTAVDHSKFSDQGDRAAPRAKNKTIAKGQSEKKKLELKYSGGKAKIKDKNGTVTEVSWGSGFGTEKPKPNPKLSAAQKNEFIKASDEFIRLGEEIAKKKKNPAYKAAQAKLNQQSNAKRYYLEEFLPQGNATVMQVFPLATGLDVMDADVASLFMNSLRTLTISQAVPYIEINVLRNAKKDEETDNLENSSTMSLGKFLGVGAPGADERADPMLGVFIPRSQEEAQRREAQSTNIDRNQIASMEIFTTPQTMPGYSNLGVSYSRELGGPTDIFRPFLGLRSLSINDSPTGAGADSWRSGNLKLTLFDKGRMLDVSEFVTPRRYGDIRFEITWGWSHPAGLKRGRLSDANIDDRLGQLVDAMKVTETYSLLASSYNMNDDGSMDIDLRIATQGYLDLSAQDIASLQIKGDSELKVGKETMTITELQNRLREISLTVQSAAGFGTKNVLLPSFFKNPNASNLVNLSRRDVRKIKKLAEDLKTSKNTSYKKAGIELLAIFAGKNNAVNAIAKSRKETINGIIDHLKKTPDPFLRDNFITGRKFRNATQFVSYGKLMTYIFAGAYGTDPTKELQLVFSSFNRNAAGAFSFNIAQFPIPLESSNKEKRTLKNVMHSQLAKRPRITLQDFVRIIRDQFINFYGADIYNLSNATASIQKKKNQQNKQISLKTNMGRQRIERSNLQRVYGGQRVNPTFTAPKVHCRISTKSSKTGKTIIRVHFLDRAAGRLMSTASSLIDLIRKGKVVKENYSTGNNQVRTPRHNEIYNRNFQELVDSKLIRQLDKKEIEDVEIELRNSFNQSNVKNVSQQVNKIISKLQNYYFLSNPDDEGKGSGKIRKFFFQNSPYFLHGIEGSGIISANISTEVDDQLMSIRMVDHVNNTKANLRPERTFELPFEANLAKISLKAFGCPMVNMAQQYFIDFGTGTSLDNFYQVNSVTHEISSDGYTMSIGLHPQDVWGSYSNALNQAEDLLAEGIATDKNKIIRKTIRAARRRRAARRAAKINKSFNNFVENLATGKGLSLKKK